MAVPRRILRNAVALLLLCSTMAVTASGNSAAKAAYGPISMPPLPPPRVLAWEGRQGAPAPVFRFAKAYGSHMVLAAAPKRASVWGYAAPGAVVNVTVTMATSEQPHIAQQQPRQQQQRPRSRRRQQQHAVVADPDGAWKVYLDPVEAGPAPHVVTAAIAGGGSLQLLDVLFGAVWVCGGQSNMEYTVRCSTRQGRAGGPVQRATAGMGSTIPRRFPCLQAN